MLELDEAFGALERACSSRTASRHRDACLIIQGGRNPSGIAYTLLDACTQCAQEGVDRAGDPAVRLIVTQITWLIDCRTKTRRTDTA